jgi:NMD protein affecting ribosome stability and mRNA decay
MNEHHEDERPQGWGICADCGRDCEQSDYDAWTRTSLCAKCWAMQDDRRNSPPDDYSGEAA